MTIIDLAATTVTTDANRLDQVIHIYESAFGWRPFYDGPLGAALAGSWRVSDPGRRLVVLGAPGEYRGHYRLMAGPTPAPHPLATIGWSSLEITVRHVDALHDRLLARPEFRVNGAPRDLKFSQDPPGQRAMQAVGPAGEQLYLTQILRQSEGRSLAVPPAGAEVGAVFIAVLATRDFDAAARFYRELLGMDLYLDGTARLSVATREMGLPEETVYRLGALRPHGETRIELDGYPLAVSGRPKSEGELPGGFGLASFYVRDFDETLARLMAAGHPPIAKPVAVDILPYDGKRSAVVTGGDGELVELIGE